MENVTSTKDYQVWRPDLQYSISEIVNRLPWVDDAAESAIVMVPVRDCGRPLNHSAHLTTTIGRRAAFPVIVYCRGKAVAS